MKLFVGLGARSSRWHLRSHCVHAEYFMTSLHDLTDDEIQVKAIIWRREALQGNKNAFGPAHRFEAEGRRRSASRGSTGLCTLDVRPVPFWQRLLSLRSITGSTAPKRA